MYTKKLNKNHYVKKDLGDKKKKGGKKRSKKTNKKKSTKKRKTLKKRKQGGAPVPPPSPSPSPVRSNDSVSTTPLNEVMTIKKPSFLDSQYNYGNNAHDCVYVGIGCFIKNDTYYNDNFNRIKKYQMLPFFLKDFNHPLIILIDKLEDDDRIKREMDKCITTIQRENPQFHPRIYWINGLFQPHGASNFRDSISHRKLKDFLENGTFFQNADQKFTENNLFLCNYARFWRGPSTESSIGNLIPKSLQKIISELRVELNDSNNFIEQNRTYIKKLGALRDNNNLFSQGNDEILFIFPTYEYIILDEPSDSNLTLPMEIPPKKTFEYLYISRSEYIESFSLRKIVNIANDIAVNPSVSNDFFDFFFKKITPS